LGAFHSQLQFAIDQAIGRRDHDALQMRIAEKLLEPDFEKYPELRGHTHAVVARTEAFGRFLGITQHEVDIMRIVAMVHDVGMRLLDYDRLYRKRDLSHDELTLLQQHPVVGAALVEPLLGQEIARAVLAHHERFDGGGYPHDLRGTDIPFPARLVQICDIYEAMTAADNYQVPLSHDAAMAVIGRGAGSQFDGELAARFQAMMAASR
jgi:HD-GYP domain-containing protein (c-di-GMP phosphodiesterase class II)